MSLCNRRSGFKRRSLVKRGQETPIRTLTYHDSDEDGSGHDETPNGSSPIWSCERDHVMELNDDQCAEFLELDMPVPSPISSPPGSPKTTRRLTRRRKRYSPIPFGLEEVEEEQGPQQVPGSEVISPSDGDLSPPHRKMRALRLFDTPHTPKSLLEKARRRRPTSGDKPRIAVDRPQTNVNPFTPSPVDPNDSGIYCGKRSRSVLESSR